MTRRKFGMRLLWSVTAALAAVAVTGCGGGGSGTTTPAFFAGTYSGSFAGTAAAGFAIGGQFTATVDSGGNLVGTVTQGGATFPATGSVDRNGNITVTSSGGSGTEAFTSVLTGQLEARNGSVIGTGTFSTSRSGVANAATGRFTAIRSRTINNPFAGAYSGTVTSTTPAGINGTFNLTANNSGSVFGLFNQTGAGTYAATGFITPAGEVLIYAVGSAGGNAPQQFVSTLTGTAVPSGNDIVLAGTFETVQGNSTQVAGVFRGTRQ